MIINHLNESDVTALWHQYPGDSEPQPAYLELDLRHGQVTCDWQAKEDHPPDDVFYQDTVRIYLPRPGLLPRYANQLMEEVKGLALAVHMGHEGRAGLVSLSNAAERAILEIKCVIARDYSDISMYVDVIDAYAYDEEYTYELDKMIMSDCDTMTIVELVEADLSLDAGHMVAVHGLEDLINDRREDE